jgi:hypothetical protein
VNAPTPRKPVQIATCIEGARVRMHTLCNDGSMWFLSMSGEWIEITPIPQPDIPSKKHGYRTE